MFPTTVKSFVHPHSVYRLEYPAIWDQVVEKDGESCGFGPHERDDIGLWISILPMSVDTTRLQEDLPKLMEQSLEKAEAVNLRRDPTLKHYGLIADMTKEGEGAITGSSPAATSFSSPARRSRRPSARRGTRLFSS